MRFLFITKEYPPTPDPSGRIVYNLAKELKKRGHYVDVIARNTQANVTKSTQGNVYWLKITRWEQLCQRVQTVDCPKRIKVAHGILTYLRKLFLAIRIRHFPNVEVSITRKTVRLYHKQLACNQYDAIMSFFRPYSCLAAAIDIAKHESSMTCISCYFDLVEDTSCPRFMPMSLYKRLINKGDRYVFENSDYVMLPKAARNQDHPLFDEFVNKIVLYEFPTFNIDELCFDYDLPNQKQDNENQLKLVFAGTLNKGYRNPEKMLALLNGVSLQYPNQVLELDVFGGGDCIPLLESFQAAPNFILHVHGRVPKEVVLQYEARADVLVNIMNNYATLVPSKIFELFASRKPILNIASETDDGSLEYFNKYPLVYTAHWDEPQQFTRVLYETELFLNTTKGRKVDLTEIKVQYHTCTPSYMIDQIIQLCREKS